jgi:endonuclease/exonuclease/phosphatase (EEP) superfamily protein YafD
LARLRALNNPERTAGLPLKRWQRAELWAFVLVIAVQLWLYRISVPAAAAWGLLVPALLIHIYLWMAPLVREQSRHDRGEEPD